MKDLLIKQIEELLERIAYAEYNNDMCSTHDYSYEVRYLSFALASLISVAKELDIDLKSIKASWCGYEVVACNFEDLQEKLKYL